MTDPPLPHTPPPPAPDTDTLFAAVADDPADQVRLRARLAAAAADEGLLDIAYRTVDSPVGQLLLAATDAGLLRVAFHGEDHDLVLGVLAERVSPRLLLAPARLEGPARELAEYFAGRRRTFDVPLDLRLAQGFRRTVLDRLRTVAYGRTTTYAALASDAGRPRAVRAAGTACATNPLPLVVPCHRVVRSDGTTGHYAGGADAKRQLLALEAA